jgi:hypothetical protein
LISASPLAGPTVGGTTVTLRGAHFGCCYKTPTQYISFLTSINRVLISASPLAGPTVGGTTVTLRGAHFGGGGTAYLGDTLDDDALCGIVAVRATEVELTVPPGQGRRLLTWVRAIDRRLSYNLECENEFCAKRRNSVTFVAGATFATNATSLVFEHTRPVVTHTFPRGMPLLGGIKGGVLGENFGTHGRVYFNNVVVFEVKANALNAEAWSHTKIVLPLFPPSGGKKNIFWLEIGGAKSNRYRWTYGKARIHNFTLPLLHIGAPHIYDNGLKRVNSWRGYFTKTSGGGYYWGRRLETRVAPTQRTLMRVQGENFGSVAMQPRAYLRVFGSYFGRTPNEMEMACDIVTNATYPFTDTSFYCITPVALKKEWLDTDLEKVKERRDQAQWPSVVKSLGTSGTFALNFAQFGLRAYRSNWMYLMFHYDDPRVYSVTGCGDNGCSSKGGEMVTIRGKNFGFRADAALIDVHIGEPRRAVWSATRCRNVTMTVEDR